MKKILLWFIMGGLIYYGIEGFWRIHSNHGWANITMFFIGGLCFVLVGSINTIPSFYNSSMRLQAMIGAFMVLIIEFISGIILNCILGLGIWNYSNTPFNILGQVCLLYGILWFLLMPFAIWLEDRLNLIRYVYLLYRHREVGSEPLYDYTLLQAYKELITF
jgi:uncharacterized membrane protein